ncbi:cytochrome P450 [Streptomyces sp. NPDC127051]|uniref:cytochrome P450 n=1 Tax=Streptomyces sp. NPDC127051 TaxID=3347119 RepID=UPI00364FCCE1
MPSIIIEHKKQHYLPNVTEPRAAELYALLRRRGGVRRGALWNGFPTWVVFDDALARDCLRDPRLVNDARAVPDAPHGMPGARYAGDLVSVLRNPLSSDGAEHRRLRASITPLLSAQAVRRWAPVVQRTVDDVLRRLQATAHADLVVAFARPVAETLAGELIGIPESQRTRVLRLMRLLSSAAPPESPQMKAAATEVAHLLDEIANGAMERPGRGIAALLADARLQGALHCQNELVDMLAAAVFAVLDSTTATLSTGALYLLRDESARERLRAGGEEADSVIEEVIRLACPFPTSGYRFATEPLRIGAARMERGDIVCVSLLAANLDPAVWADPLRVDPSRALARHLSFGLGRHYCPGAALGRMIVRSALKGLFALPGLRLTDLPGRAAPGQPYRYRQGISRYPHRMPVLVGQR